MELTDSSLSPDEIGQLMCAVARDNTWRKGKRDFMQSSREIANIQLTVRTKSMGWALSTKSWRLGLRAVGFATTGLASGMTVFGSSTPDGEATTRLPHPAGGEQKWKHAQIGHKRWANIKLPKKDLATSLMYYKITTPIDFYIEDQSQFETDWTILKLFSSEWKIEPAA